MHRHILRRSVERPIHTGQSSPYHRDNPNRHTRRIISLFVQRLRGCIARMPCRHGTLCHIAANAANADQIFTGSRTYGRSHDTDSIQSRQCHRRPMRRTSYRSRSGPAILVAHRSRFRSTRHRVSVPVLPAQISLEPVTHALYDCHKCAMPPTPQCITDFQRLRYYLMSPPALSACPIHAKARITTNSISIVISINITRKATMTFTSKINRHPGQRTAHQS